MDGGHAISMEGENSITDLELRSLEQSYEFEEEAKDKLYFAVAQRNLKEVNRLCRTIDHDESLDEAKSRYQANQLKFMDNNEKTPLHVAVQNKDVDVTRILCRCANVLIKNKYLAYDAFFGVKNSAQQTVLHLAVENHDKATISLLLDVENSSKNKFLLQKDASSNGYTALHIAVVGGMHDGVLEVLCQHYDHLEAMDIHGRSALHLATANYRDALAGLQELNVSTDGELLIRNSSLLSSVQRQYYYTVRHLSSFHKTCTDDIRSAFIITYDILVNVTSDERIVQGGKIVGRVPDSADYREVLEKLFGDDPDIIETLQTHCHSELIDEDEKILIQIIIDFLFIGLQKYSDDPAFRFIFFKGNIYKSIIKILINTNKSKTITFIEEVYGITLYKCIQSKAMCEETESIFLRANLDAETWVNISAVIDEVTMKQSTIFLNIYDAYFAQKKPSSFNSLKQYFEKMDLPRMTHSCTLQGYFSTLTCSSAIFIYLSDLLSDAHVGYEDYHHFSKRLGIFEMFLVSFSFIHENIRSSHSLYETEEELLCIQLGKPQLDFYDWKSDYAALNTSERPVQKLLYRIFWPFRVTGDKLQRFKAITFNVMSAMMLRPVVDRLRVLTHSPTTHRVFHRQKANQAHLQQYYMILEQIPELMVQFYTFQIVLNNIMPDNQLPECYSSEAQVFQYYQFYSISVISCSSVFSIITSLGMCSAYIKVYTAIMPFIRVYSIAIPFCKIPASIVSLEKVMRRLDPTSPRMSAKYSILLHLCYSLMIPSRIFLFSGLMHAFTDHFYVIGYLILSSISWLLVNITFFQGYNLLKIKRCEQWNVTNLLNVLKNLWLLYVLSFRDMFLIALRNPEAYIKEPSNANCNSLRTYPTLLKLSLLFVVEGILGAALLEQYYPCGMQTNFFRFIGWGYYCFAVFSTSLLTFISYHLHPNYISDGNPSSEHRKILSGCLLGLCTGLVILMLINLDLLTELSSTWVEL